MNNIVPTDSASVFAALNTLVMDSAQLAIVRPNNPPPGIAGFVFDVVGEDQVELDSEIPDHYVESNTPVQDMIALRPEIVVTNGEIAELVKSIIATKPITLPQNPLPILNGLQPQLAPGATVTQQNQEALAAAEDASVQNTYSLYGYYQSRVPQQPNQTRQSAIFGFLYQLWWGRQLCSVETPWGFFTNMAIESIRTRQPEESKSRSEFVLTFKKIRTVKSVTVTAGLLAGRAVFQQAVTTQNGTVGQTPVSAIQSAQFFNRITPPVAP